jgi:hypothetical protein
VVLDYFGSDVVQVRIRLHFTDSTGRGLDPKLILRRRKAICKTWWNHDWLARLFATLELLSEGGDTIQVGTTPEGKIVLSRWPRVLSADMRLNEELLRPANLAAQEFAEVATPETDEELVPLERRPRLEI